jgi:hypothetical protein
VDAILCIYLEFLASFAIVDILIDLSRTEILLWASEFGKGGFRAVLHLLLYLEMNWLIMVMECATLMLRCNDTSVKDYPIDQT